MEVKNNSIFGSGPPEGIKQDALVKALKQHQGHTINQAIGLISKSGTTITVKDNQVTIKNGEETLTINLNKMKSTNLLASLKFSKSSSKDKDNIQKLANVLLLRLREPPKDAESSSNTPIKTSEESAELKINKEESEESSLPSLPDLLREIQQLRDDAKPTTEMQKIDGRYKNVETSPGNPGLLKALDSSELFDQVFQATKNPSNKIYQEISEDPQKLQQFILNIRNEIDNIKKNNQ